MILVRLRDPITAAIPPGGHGLCLWTARRPCSFASATTSASTSPAPVPVVTLLTVHPSRRHDLREPDRVQLDPAVELEEYPDLFGNLSTRFIAPPGIAAAHKLAR